MSEAAAAHRVRIGFRGHNALSVLCFEHDEAEELQTLFTIRMLDQGFLVGAAFYPSLAHEEHHVDTCVAAAAHVFAELGSAIQQGNLAMRLKGEVKHSGFKRLA
jgi:hypothetical protein